MHNMENELEQMGRQELMSQIMAVNFRITELTLYLNTRPDDRKALILHNEACKQYRDLTERFQRIYGPLTNQYPCNKWRWIEEPWPWEGEM